MREDDSYLDMSQYIRVLRVAKQPSSEEFTRIAVVSGIGIVLVGLLGFIIFAIMSFIPV